MAVREVLRFPDPALKRRCRQLDPRAERELIARVAGDLLDTMRATERCVGLAAPQIGELVRIAVVDVSGHPRGKPAHGELVLVNPVVTGRSGSEVAREGCQSLPEVTANVRRATAISVFALDADAGGSTLDTAGFEARAILHELDHLDGILILDRVDSLSADVFARVQR